MRSWQEGSFPWSNVFQGIHRLNHKELWRHPDLGNLESQARPIALTHKSQIKDNHLQPCVQHAPAGCRYVPALGPTGLLLVRNLALLLLPGSESSGSRWRSLGSSG